MKSEIAKENIRNKNGLWQWIKEECEADNIENVALETFYGEAPTETPGFTIKYIDHKILTITLGAKRG